jgi:hypothetical protein
MVEAKMQKFLDSISARLALCRENYAAYLPLLLSNEKTNPVR